MGLTLIDIGRKVKVARKQRRVRQVDLARLSGLSIDTIRKLEQGKSTSTIKTLLAISAVLNKRLVIFFDEM